MFFGKEKNVKGFIYDDSNKQGELLYGVPIISIEKVDTLDFADLIICITGEVAKIEKLVLLFKNNYE